ncbi:MAG: recombinase family protein [Dysosmobacter sp.]|nr:recombinase family protein [Dysosmobacter sp.]
MNKNRVWIYCRTAYPDLTALEIQKSYLTDYADKHDLSIVGITAEHGSGLDYSRAGLCEVLDAAEDGRIDCVLIKNLERLGRDLLKTDGCIRWLKERNVEIICADGMLPQTDAELLTYLMQISGMTKYSGQEIQ